MNELISVVIPCRNEVKSIEATVRAILDSEDVQVEVLVVDGMSEDGTRDVLSRLETEDARVKMLDNPNKLTPFAFNIGCKAARGGYVQIAGSRNVMAKDYLYILKQHLDAHPEVACVGGDYQHVFDSDSGRWIAMAMESKFGVGGGNYRTMGRDSYVDTVGVPMYRTSVFQEVGYFDESLTRNQDDEFNYRVRQKGLKIQYVHAAKVTYLVRGSLKKAFQQYRQYGYFKVYVNRKHGAVTTMRQVVPAAFLTFLGLSLPLSLASENWARFTAWVLIVYALLGILLAGQRLLVMERVQVLAACFVLHLGYGLGYLQGIWDFIVTKQAAPRAALQRQTT